MTEPEPSRRPGLTRRALKLGKRALGVVKRPFSAIGTGIRTRRERLRGRPNVREVSGAVAGAVATNVGLLRESAIEPLPQVDPMPSALRNLDWLEKPDRPIDAAGIVRRLRKNAVSPDERNELGCAYALLAWEHGRDDYWLEAVKELRAAADGGSTDAAKRAVENLRSLKRISPFPVGDLPEDE